MTWSTASKKSADSCRLGGLLYEAPGPVRKVGRFDLFVVSAEEVDNVRP